MKKEISTIKEHLSMLITNSTYYRDIYYHLLKFESEFTNVGQFIINCDISISYVYNALQNETNDERMTVKHICDNEWFYDPKIYAIAPVGLNQFEMYLIKFIVADCLAYPSVIPFVVKNTREYNKRRSDYYQQIEFMTKSRMNEFTYFIEFEKYQKINGGINEYWLLKLNPNKVLQNLNNSTMLSEPPLQKVIEPIQWQKDATLLAYLFNELQKKGFIKDKTLWKKLTFFFVDKEGINFKNRTFPNLITSYGKTKTIHNGKNVPTDHKDISDIVSVLVEVINQTKK